MKIKGTYDIEVQYHNSVRQIKESTLSDKKKSERISKLKNEILDKIKDLLYSN